MLKDYKYFMEHYNDYEDKVNELIKDVTDYVEDDIKNKINEVFSNKYLYPSIIYLRDKIDIDFYYL